MRSKNGTKAHIERLRQKAEAAKTPAPTDAPPPPPVPEPELSDPEVRAEALSDELRDARAALEAEKKARSAAERRATQAEATKVEAGSRTGLANLISKRRRAPWK